MSRNLVNEEKLTNGIKISYLDVKEVGFFFLDVFDLLLGSLCFLNSLACNENCFHCLNTALISFIKEKKICNEVVCTKNDSEQ